MPVELTEELFNKVRKAIEDARAIAASGTCPPPLKNDARCLYCSAYPICLPNESLWWSKRRKETASEGQLQFGFIGQTADAVRDKILEALDFAADSTGKEPTLQPPRPGGDDGEVLVVQTPGAQIGQRGGRRPFWESWFRRLDTEVSHPEFSYKMAYRRMLEVQARQLWRFVRGEALSYHGFITR